MAKKKKRASSNGTAYIYGGILVMISAIALLHEYTGFLGQLFYQLSYWMFGEWWFLIFALLCFIAFHYFYYHKAPKTSSKVLISLVLLLAAAFMFRGIPEDKSTGTAVIKDFWDHRKDIFKTIYPTSGGLVGTVLYGLVSAAVSYWGTIVVIVILTALAIFIMFGFDNIADKTVAGTTAVGSFFINTAKAIKNVFKSISDRAGKKPAAKKPESKKNAIPDDIPITDGQQLKLDNFDEITEQVPVVKKAEPKINVTTPQPVITETTSSGTAAETTNYKLPNISMMLDTLSVSGASNNRTAVRKKGQQLIDILSEFDLNCTLEGIKIGPSVTQFSVKPQSGIRVGKITSLAENIKMGLAVKYVRIEAPIPGRNVVGIEIPNETRTNVQMRELLSNVPEEYNGKPLMMALGKDLSGENIYAEIGKMPHLLIAGSTGSGKSVCENSIITTLLLRTRPDEVKLLLIDPKMVEFAQYHDVPHLIGPVISDASEACNALKKIVSIMENRYTEFKNQGVRSISEYNDKAIREGFNRMFYIVIVIDELADLMSYNEKDVSASIQRITQLARASGIHLIVATQRPSTDVVTGTIKANIPSRIAFSVANAIDSRIVLDQPGAENLLGLGDMLYIPMGESAARRIQGVYVSDDEINRITEYCRNQMKPQYEDIFVVGDENNIEYINMQNADPQYEAVRKYVIKTQRASTSSIQRYFGFGYNRAARIMDTLEKEGVIGPANGSKPREIFYRPEDIDDDTF